jgi:uncharacterized FlaG/YvyC family protein
MVEEIGGIGPVGSVGSGDAGSTATLPSSAAVRPLRPMAAAPNSQNAPPQAAPTVPAPSAQQIQADFNKVNAQLASENRVIQMQVDRATGLTIVTVRNSTTGEVLQQFPGADSVHLAQMLAAWAAGKNFHVDLIA